MPHTASFFIREVIAIVDAVALLRCFYALFILAQEPVGSRAVVRCRFIYMNLNDLKYMYINLISTMNLRFHFPIGSC